MHARLCTHTHAHQQPHYPSFRRGLCFVPLESDSDLWRRGVTLHPDTHSNTKQGYWPKHGYKERLLLHQQSHTDSSACCGPGSTPHQCSPMDEFSRPTKWKHWPLSITCFDEFHEYESLCFLTQWFLNDSSGNCPDVTLGASLYASFWRHFVLHYHCGFVRVVNPERPDTPCLSAQVCHPQCQAFFFFFCEDMLDPLYICYQLQLRWGQHIPSDSLWVLRTQGSDLAGNLQQFQLHGWFWNTHIQILQGENWFSREYFFYTAATELFVQRIAKSILGASLLLLTFLPGHNRKLWYTVL